MGEGGTKPLLLLIIRQSLDSIEQYRVTAGEFDILTRVFDSLGIQKNEGKTVRMICRPFRAVRTQLYEDYKHRMTGSGLTYQAHQIL